MMKKRRKQCMIIYFPMVTAGTQMQRRGWLHFKFSKQEIFPPMCFQIMLPDLGTEITTSPPFLCRIKWDVGMLNLPSSVFKILVKGSWTAEMWTTLLDIHSIQDNPTVNEGQSVTGRRRHSHLKFWVRCFQSRATSYPCLQFCSSLTESSSLCIRKVSIVVWHLLSFGNHISRFLIAQVIYFLLVMSKIFKGPLADLKVLCSACFLWCY